MSAIELRGLGPDDAEAIDDFVAIDNALHVDALWQHPATAFRRRMILTHGWDGEPGRHFLAHADGQGGPVGFLVVHTTEYDNPDLAWLHFGIHPDHRRRGHGTALLDAAYDVCRTLGRSLLGADGWDSERTRSFAAATGWELKSQAINRRQHLAELVPGLAQTLVDEAAPHAADYELVRIAGYSPEELLEPLAVAAAAINDAPLDDLELEDDVITAERIKAYETAQTEGANRLYRIVARHRDTGELGGLTVAAVASEAPTIGDQHDTSVVAAHRGHRLGQLLKADMMRWLADAEPQLETIDTWNAESNDHMIGINERLGYRVMGRGLQFQKRL
jgi:GNAT superfamily N-acetyltransferase